MKFKRAKLSISEGFEHLTNEWGWYKKCKNLGRPLNPNTATSLKGQFKKGKLSEAKMIKLLSSAGYKIIEAKCKIPLEE